MTHPPLPVQQYSDTIYQTVRNNRFTVISAPPGSGKSTIIPLLFLNDPAIRVVHVLQPRRVAARQLAAWGAAALGERVGERVGYRVRFESCCGRSTRVVYQTCGTFVRELLDNPLPGPDQIVILDEFHERSLENDLVLTWLTGLARHRAQTPALVVMSATMHSAPLCGFLDNAPHIEIPAHTWPVTTQYLAPGHGEDPTALALRGVRAALEQTQAGSVLVFLSGKREIDTLYTALTTGPHGVPTTVRTLHGGLDLTTQQEALDCAARTQTVILATNVAETSLTIPGVSAVVDTGYENRAGYDPDTGRNSLYKVRISRFSAVQRAGRAGRNGPGVCIRLYSNNSFNDLEEAAPPHIERLELGTLLLQLLVLLDTAGLRTTVEQLPWLTAPDPDRLASARQNLLRIGAIVVQGQHMQITPLGRAIAQLPLDPQMAAVACRTQSDPLRAVHCAMLVLLDSERDAGLGDLLESAVEALNKERPFSAEQRKLFARLCPQTQGFSPPQHFQQLQSEIAEIWAEIFAHHLGAATGSGRTYQLADNTRAVLAHYGSGPATALPPVVIALTVRHSAGSTRNRSTRIVTWLECPRELLATLFPNECARESSIEWDESTQSVSALTATVVRGIRTQVQRAPGHSVDAPRSAELLARIIVGKGEYASDTKVSSFLNRLRVAHTCCPDYGFPAFDTEELVLALCEACLGKSSLASVRGLDWLAALRAYTGPVLCQALDTLCPVRTKLPGGRFAAINYPDNAPPELSARIGDLIGMSSSFTICENKVNCVFDILAPNYRTVQKTANLGGFWSGAYIEIKKELKRRYPRHPWP